MEAVRSASACWIILVVVATGCAAPAPLPPASSQPGDLPKPGLVKRITAATAGEPDIFPGVAIPGDAELRLLVNAGLTVIDNRGARRGQLAEDVPTVQNSLWKLFPDGRMETTWKIRPGAQWHDGSPLTSDDLLFTARVGQDKELPAFGHVAYGSIEGIDAPDAQTITVKWRRPNIEADTMFTSEVTSLLPKHLLEKGYAEDKASFTQLPYWSQEYVGAGPFKIREWARGSHLVLEANNRYVLGRPKIDEIEIRFIPDANTLMANLLSGAVEMTVGRTLSVEQAIQMREQWREGNAHLEFGADNWLVLLPQFINPNPPVVADVRFRKGLMHAIDRQEMADTLNAGLVPVAHSYLSPNQPEYRDIEARLVRYDYDPRKATQMIEALGYARGPDGALRPDSLGRDASSQRLELEIRNIGLEISRKSMFAVADYWQRIGIPTSTVVIPQQRVADYEYRATFPGFQLFNQPNDQRGLPNLHSSRTRLPENNFLVPGAGNHTRYTNPEFDALLDRYLTTIPKQERIEVLGQIVYHISDQLNLMGLFYNGSPDMISHRLLHVTTQRASGSTISWNAHEWDARP